MTTQNPVTVLPAPLYRRRDFPSADAKYRALVNDGRATYTLQERVSDYTGTHELSQTEAEMFGLDPAFLPELAWAYERYENLIGSMDVYFGEFTERERIDQGRYFRGECIWSFNHALYFMIEVCGLPPAQCFGWIAKIVAANARGGLYD